MTYPEVKLAVKVPSLEENAENTPNPPRIIAGWLVEIAGVLHSTFIEIGVFLIHVVQSNPMLAEVGEGKLAYRGAVGRCGCRREAPRTSDEFRSRDLHRIGLEVVHHHEEQVPLRVDPADDEATECQAAPPRRPARRIPRTQR